MPFSPRPLPSCKSHLYVEGDQLLRLHAGLRDRLPPSCWGGTPSPPRPAVGQETCCCREGLDVCRLAPGTQEHKKMEQGAGAGASQAQGCWLSVILTPIPLHPPPPVDSHLACVIQGSANCGPCCLFSQIKCYWNAAILLFAFRLWLLVLDARVADPSIICGTYYMACRP